MTLREILEYFKDHAKELDKEVWVESNGDLIEITEVHFSYLITGQEIITLLADNN